jgi:hypothetical protein
LHARGVGTTRIEKPINYRKSERVRTFSANQGDKRDGGGLVSIEPREQQG